MVAKKIFAFIGILVIGLFLMFGLVSGAGYNIVVPTVSGGTTTTSGDEAGGTGTPSFWKNTFLVNEEQFEQGFTRERGGGERFRVVIDGENHHVGVVSLTDTTATINVSSETQQATLVIGDTRRFEVTNDSYYDVQVILNSIADDKADLTIKSISEEVTEETEAEEREKEAVAKGEEAEKRNLIWLWWLIGIVVLVIVVWTLVRKKKNN